MTSLSKKFAAICSALGVVNKFTHRKSPDSGAGMARCRDEPDQADDVPVPVWYAAALAPSAQ